MAATKHAQEIKNDTKEYITTAMIQLLTKENLSNITVSKVCKRAGVSRMAFYRNYDHLEQVLYEHYQPIITSVFEKVHQSSDNSVKLDLQLVFFNTFGDVFIQSIDREFEYIIKRIAIEEIEKFYAKDNDEYQTTFMAAGVYAIWRKWLLNGREKQLKDIIAFLKKVDASMN